jgi:hypothetical protein
MLSLDDPRWSSLCGGHRTPYDAAPALRELEQGVDVWEELRDGLHHQGDVDEASYAAVPQLVRILGAQPQRSWHFYSLVAIIELERHRAGNPPVPAWCRTDYAQAWVQVLALALQDLRLATDPHDVQALLGALALARGQLELGALLVHTDTSELEAILEQRLAWSVLYRG